MRTHLLKIKAVLISVMLLAGSNIRAQSPVAGSQALPQEYYKLGSDTARMRFLVHAISDSLDEGQLTQVHAWSRIGLAMAEKNKVDTMKGIFLFDIAKAFTYKYNKFDSAIFYYKQVPAYFPDRNRKYNAFSIREIMERYADMGNKDSCLAYVDTLKTFIDTMAAANPKKVALSQNIATCYQWFGMYRSAIRYFQIAVNGNRLNKNFRGLGLALANLGELHNSMEDPVKAISYSKEALDYLADVNMPYMQTATNIADYYIGQKQNDSAMAYLQKSDAVARKINDEAQLIINQVILARIYISLGKSNEAKLLLMKALQEQSKTDDNWNLCRTLLYTAELDTSLHQYNEAKSHLLQVMDISKNKEFRIYTVTALQNMALLLSKTGNYKDALQYQLEYSRLRDSLSTTRAKTDLNDLEISYKTIQKEQEIELLKKDNDLKTLELKNSRQSLIFYVTGFIMLLAISGIIFYQRNRRQKIESERMKAELQTQILRSQMNPHFIFNCLNSIENFIMQNNKRQASDYLNKFSLLIRNILNSSRNEVVPVAKDMEALQLYIELEQLRFNYKFDYKLLVDPLLKNGDYRVPSLLIQPFVENAIVHGLAHSEENDLNLIITASLDNENIRYTIQDNGVGREKAKVYNMKNKPYHKSVGLKITEERINLYNNDNKEDAIRITDLYDDNRNPDGTRIEIILKAV